MLEEEKAQLISAKEKRGIDYLWEKLPHFSWYQLRITAMAGYSAVIGGFMAVYPVFAQLKPPHRCQTELDKRDGFSWLSWEEIKALTTGGSTCNRAEMNDGCGHCIFDSTVLESCNHQESFESLKTCLGNSSATWSESCNGQFNFDRSLSNMTNKFFNKGEPWETAVTEFKLICGDEWFDSLSTSLALLMLAAGAFIAGIYGDRFGRKNAIQVWNFITAICLTIHAFAPNKYVFMIMRALGNGFGHISYLAQKTYAMELTGPSKRHITGPLGSVYFALGYVLSGTVAYFFPSWRDLTLVYAFIAFATLLTLPFYPESPMFLYSRGKTEEARKIFREMGRRTGTRISDELLEKVEGDILKNDQKERDDEAIAEQYSILDLFRHRNLSIVSILVGVAFVANTLVYYGLVFNVARFAGNLYVNNTINGSVEVLAYVVLGLTLDRFGRRWIAGGFLVLGGIACLACMALEEVAKNAADPSNALELQRWMAFLGHLFISGSFGAMYIYGVELFPTPLRSTGIGFGSICGRFGSVLAPFIIQIKNRSIVYLIFGAVGVIGGAFVFLLPETAGVPLCQTLEESLDFYEKSNKKLGSYFYKRRRKLSETSKKETDL
ncbi:Oidioi.mRNA.OKI2018_I69.chr1.g3718.t1.cds [Oikopleura dioica]|uniref:Oidioi.mRNA.OKI2018_I69.chr1.g3718.t1.cds n=1 Tax=Oikopleura dioica TaxID=34765 RepID=A0ABN7T1V5_OIKDI|nr:Oidioi.mRNA.OKI2018_I69.chr1.g3718.t1.cds [Oikopleura dioica]